MPTLTILRGLQGAGKTAQARHVVKNGKRTFRVERDCLREMLHFELWNPKHEKIVTKVQDAVIALLLDEGYDVVSSDTNLNLDYVHRLRCLAADHGAVAKTDNTLMTVPVEECIWRDLGRQKSVGERVIRQTYHRYRDQFGIDESDIYNDKTLPAAMIIDVDGTLADISHRNPYDTAKCLDDMPRWEVVAAVTGVRDILFLGSGVHPFVFSGRSDKYRAQTQEWLESCLSWGFTLAMRKDGDSRPDEVIKKELLEEHIRGKYRVAVVFDDRPKVVRMWRDLGLKVFDCGVGVEFEMVKVLLYGNSYRTWYMNKELHCPECGAFYILEVGDRRLVSGVTSHAVWFNCPLCDTELEAKKGEGGDLVTRRTEPLPNLEQVR